MKQPERYSIFRFLVGVAFLAIFFLAPVFSQTEEETELYSKGSAQCLKAEWKPAIATFKKLLQLYPNTTYEDVRYWIGHASIEQGQYREGIKWLDEFATRYPHNTYAAEALFKMGEAYEIRLKEYDKALKAYERVAKLYPTRVQSVNAVQNQAEIYAQRSYDYEKAEKTLAKSRSMAVGQGISPQSPFVSRADDRIRFIRENSDHNYEPLRTYTRGINMEEVRKWNEAIEIYRGLLKKYPDANIADDARYRIIECCRSMGKKDKAKAEAENFLKKHPTSRYAPLVQAVVRGSR